MREDLMRVNLESNMKLKLKQWLNFGTDINVGTKIAEFYYIDKYGNYGITNEIELDDAPKPDQQLSESQMMRELGKCPEARKSIYSLLENTDKRIKYFLPQKKGSGRITEEMKLTAKDYPVEHLLEFDNRNTTACIWEEHSTARLSKPSNKNFVKCFACNRSADSIEIYKTLNNCDFKTAVRELAK